MTVDRNYLERRMEQEQEAARLASSPEARAAHEELAGWYRQQLQSPDLSIARVTTLR